MPLLVLFAFGGFEGNGGGRYPARLGKNGCAGAGFAVEEWWLDGVWFAEGAEGVLEPDGGAVE